MGDSIKSSDSDVEEEDADSTLKVEDSDTIIATTKRTSIDPTDSKELRNFISNQLEKQLENSIAKALASALQQIHQNEEQNSGCDPNNRKQRYYKTNGAKENIPIQELNQNRQKSGIKNRQDRIKSSPAALQMQISSSGSEDEEIGEEAGAEFDPCDGKGCHVALILISLQIGLIVLFGFFVKYDEDVTANPLIFVANSTNNEQNRQEQTSLDRYYSQYQDIQVMIFLGIGLLMTFLKKYGYSAIGFSLLAGTLTVQWTILVRGLLYYRGDMIPLNILSLIYGDFAAAVVLITYGVVIGITTPLQLILMTFLEVLFYVLNEYIGAVLFQAVDTGGSIFVHIFAAYFGLGVSRALRSAKGINSKNNDASYNSNIFCLIAVVFLWLFWPSFNSVLATGNDKHRIVLNTMLSLFGSCVFAFAASALFNKNKFIISHIQNASLAGGVAVGAVCDLMIRPSGALGIGAISGFLCVFGCQFVSTLLTRKFGIHDTCGVHNLHGIPGLVSAFAGVAMAAIASECDYGHNLYLRYPARAPLADSKELSDLQGLNPDIEPGFGRSGSQQAIYQLAAISLTMVISIVGGAITGLLMRIPIFGRIKSELNFDDRAYFEVDGDEPKETKIVQRHSTKVNGVGVGNSNEAYEASPQVKKRSKYEF